MARPLLRSLALAASLSVLAACGGGGGGKAPDPTPLPPGGPSPATRLYADPAAEQLLVSDVETVLAQAIAEAKARGLPVTLSVVDRVGNVLAVYAMTGAVPDAFIPEPPSGETGGVQGLDVPAAAAAISKALTGAYLSSGGNAFTSRTASMIVQEHFPPAPGLTNGLEGGPLFGVQFSQLPCSDLVTRYAIGQGAFIGPNRAPLGLAADPGGLPLYKNGVLVGGIGVEGDGSYAFDPDVRDVDTAPEEAIALAGTVGFEAPEDIRANRILVDGTALRFSDVTTGDLVTDPATAPGFAGLGPSDGALVPVRGYFGEDVPAIIAGTAYGTEASGIRRSDAFNTPDAYVLSDGFGTNRFAPRDATDAVAQPLTAAEVQVLLEEAFNILSRARAQIRRPLDSRAQVSVSVVDTNGEVLGIIRSPDAPIFGIDVSLQKARTAAFFSGPDAAGDLGGAQIAPILGGGPDPDVSRYVDRVRTFLDDPTALTGTFAFADRSGGNLSRPFFPDGEVGNGPGPLSVAIEDFNPFNTGLQSDLVVQNLALHLAFVTGFIPGTNTPYAGPDTPDRCGFIPDTAMGSGQNRLENGLQIFPGSVPIYRGDQLVGGIGVSGDGIDQDDMISFLGVHNAGLKLGTLNNAPPEIRADRIVVLLSEDREVRLRYVNCPFTPFIGSNEANVCQGK